jgi:metallo-beta-lactamase family protein
VHESPQDISAQLTEVVNSTVEAKGNVVIPSFALERAQEVLYYLSGLLEGDRIPDLPVFLDSPMAVRVTEVFEHYPDLLDPDVAELIRHGKSPFDFPGLMLVASRGQSMAINRITGTAIIISGSGMCTGGRIKYHLIQNISRPESTILFVGYQAVGTLGRQIVDGATEVRILGEMYPVRAKVAQIQAFSAHADRDELLRWLTGLVKPPKQVFVVHGEAETAVGFAEYVQTKTGWQTSAPSYREQISLI